MTIAAMPGDEPFSLTIITPTYDRAARLPDLYRSLVDQGDARVEWLIVDDGSRDATADVVASLMAEGRLRMRYIAKENGGKHTALNVGIPLVDSRLTMIVDSDDRLVDGAVALIEAFDDKYRGRPGLGGFSFTRIQPDGSSLLAGRLPAEEFVESYVDCRINRHLDGDMAEVFYTKVLRAYPFPVFPGERFIAEDVVWIRMAHDHDLVFVDRPIYVCEYLPGGLTMAGRRKTIRAPFGGMERAKLLMDEACCRRCRFKGGILFIAYGRLAGKGVRQLIDDSGQPILSGLALPFGIALGWLWRRRYGRSSQTAVTPPGST